MVNLLNSKLLIVIILSFTLFTGCREYAYFLDMHYSPAVDAQKQDSIGNRKGNFLPPENSVPYKASVYPLTNSLSDYPKADFILRSPFENRKENNWVLNRGKDQYRIYCSPCHGLTGKGDGPVQAKWLAIRPIVPVEDRDVPPLKWGFRRIYHVIRVGIRSMQGYASQITEENRWAIAHYVKYLQSQIATENQQKKKIENSMESIIDRKILEIQQRK